MHGETIQDDQGRNLKQPKQYKAPLVKGPWCRLEGGEWRDDQIKLFPRKLELHWHRRLDRPWRAEPEGAIRLGPGAVRPPCPVNLQNNSSLLLTSSTNLSSWVAPVDDHEQGNDPCTQRQAHPSRSSGSKVNMLEIKTSEANHKGETRIRFPKFTAHKGTTASPLRSL
jgi:hypothetical protein